MTTSATTRLQSVQLNDAEPYTIDERQRARKRYSAEKNVRWTEIGGWNHLPIVSIREKKKTSLIPKMARARSAMIHGCSAHRWPTSTRRKETKNRARRTMSKMARPMRKRPSSTANLQCPNVM